MFKKDSKSKFCFVEFAEAQSASKAEALNNTNLQGIVKYFAHNFLPFILCVCVRLSDIVRTNMDIGCIGHVCTLILNRFYLLFKRGFVTSFCCP